MSKKSKRAQRRKEKRLARKHLELNEINATTHEQEANQESSHAEHREGNLSDLAQAMTDNIPAPTGQSKKSDTATNSKYTKYIMWPFVTVWRILFGFLDKHSPSIQAIATVAIVVLTFVYVKYSKKQWQTMLEANKLTRQVFQFTQGAHVSIGRKDGMLAEFKRSYNPREMAGLEIYFQNSGHVPAKFNWGLLAWMTEPETNPPLNVAHQFTQMTRTRNRKDGSIGETGGNGGVIGGDSVQSFDVGNLPQSLIDQLAERNQLFLVWGRYEYCDELGTYACREFNIIYQRRPYDSFRMAFEKGCILPEPKAPDPNVEYLFPCKIIEEK